MRRLIDKKTLKTMVPLSERTIDAMEKRGEFPKRFALSPRCVVWDIVEIEEWMDRQKAEGRQALRPGITPICS